MNLPAVYAARIRRHFSSHAVHSGGMIVAAHITSRHPTIIAEQAIACVSTASAAKPGLISEVEVDDAQGTRLWRSESSPRMGKSMKSM